MCVPPSLSPDSRYIANFSSEANCFSSPVGSDGPEFVSELVCDSDDAVPMDYSPPYSPPSMVFPISDTQVVEEQSTDKGSHAKVLHKSSALLGKGPEKVHKWVRNHCLAKHSGGVVEPSVPPILELQVQESQDSGCLPCWVPSKKRKGVSYLGFAENLMLCYEKKGSEVAVTGCFSCLPFKKRKGISTSSSTQMSCSGSSFEGSVDARSRPPSGR